MSQRESNTVYPRNPVDEMDLTLISGPTVTAPTSALTEGPGPAPGGGEALSESNRSENYRLLRISLREGSVVVRGLHVGIVAHLNPFSEISEDLSGRADGRKQPVELSDTYRCAKASTKSGGPARPRPAPVAREAPSPTPL